MRAEKISASGALYFVVAVVAVSVAGILFRYGVVASIDGPLDFPGYVHSLCVWDCAWYETIASGGYDLEPGTRLLPGAANWAFFPLAPTLVGIVAHVTSLTPEIAGFFLSNVYVIIAALAARPLFGDRKWAWWLFVVTLLIGPFSFLFSSMHTEALFILLTVLTLTALRRNAWVEAGLWAGLLSATRVTGVLMSVAMFVHAIAAKRREGIAWRALPAAVLKDSRLMLGLALAPLGMFVFATYLYFHVGDALAFARVQRAWGRSLGNPFESLAQLSFTIDSNVMVGSAWAAAGAVGLALCVVLFIRRELAAATFCTLALLVSLAGGTVSMVRFTAGLVPLGIVLCIMLARWRPVAILTALAVLPLGAALTIGWTRSSLFVM